MLQLGVELHRAVDGLDLVVADNEPLYGGVQRDGQDIEAALLTHHHEGLIVAVAATGAVRQRRCAAPRCKKLQ